MSKSRMYQFYELRDELKKAISNSEAVEESEKALVAIVLASQKAKEFEDFTKGLSSNWKRYEGDRLELKSRLNKIEKLISIYEQKDEKSSFAEEIATYVLEALGVAAPEKKTDA